MNVEPRLNVVVLGVHDLAATRAFYQKLGWKPWPADGLFASFRLNGAGLALFPIEELADVVGVAPVEGEGFRGTATAMVVDSADDIDRVLHAFRVAGGDILAEPADRPWGSRTGYAADPEGNVWEIAHVAVPKG